MAQARAATAAVQAAGFARQIIATVRAISATHPGHKPFGSTKLIGFPST
jgi:hypothetical protein